jgi:GDP-4-dehydro-6-deoxy-D-mannose reductase
MKYLVTGITGFAGPHLAMLLLKEGHEVHGIVRTANGREQDLLDIMTLEELSSIKFHYIDLKHYYGVQKLINTEKFDGIFHLAAQSHPPTSFLDPILTWEENVNGTVNLITAIQGTPTRFMFCSTSEVYGDQGKDVGLLKVSTPLKPSNPYGTSKAAMDLYVQERSNNDFIDGFVTRAFSHTGPRRGKIFSISSDAYQIALMELGKQEKILKIGNLQTERVLMDVRDCVNAYYLLMKNPNSNKKVFNVCGSDIHKMQFYTDVLIEESKFPYDSINQVIYKPYYRDIDIQVQIGDTTELTKLTGWKTTIPVRETLRDLLDYWRKKLTQK